MWRGQWCRLPFSGCDARAAFQRRVHRAVSAVQARPRGASPPVQFPALKAPADSVVVPPGQEVQAGVGAAALPPGEKLPAAHGEQMAPPKPG